MDIKDKVPSSDCVVIVGGGQAGFSCASKLREFGFAGRLVMITEERNAPYQRPPLSKTYMTGEMSLERILLRPAHFYEEQEIELITNARVEQIERNEQSVSLDNGATYHYDTLVLATGARPKMLPDSMGGNLAGLYAMRTLDDADLLGPELIEGHHLLIIGGGYIGLEAAAVARKKGLDVTLIEAAERILQRVAASQTSDYFRALHQENGVTLLEQTALEHLLGREGRFYGVQLQNGETIEADLALVGIGVWPNQELAERAGLAVENGIVVDERAKTSDPKIYAIGDCAFIPYGHARLRLESVGHAIDHAILAAKNICGADQDYVAKPWFWSDQYTTKLQIAGLNSGYDDVIVRSTGDGAQSVWYYVGGQLLAVDAMNAPRDYLVAKRLIEAGKSPDKKSVLDATTDIKALLKTLN